MLSFSRTSLLCRLAALLALSIALLAGPPAQASEDAQSPWVTRGANGETQVHLYFYWSENCPHCLAAHPFIAAIPQQRPWVILHAREVSRSTENARHFVNMAASLGRDAEAVPTLVACGWLTVGWQDEATSGSRLLAALDACRAGNAPVVGEAELELPLLGRLDPGTLSLPLITIAIAALDAFNPCAFFVLLFLLSLLAHQKDRRRMLLIGSLFVATSGLMYFAFMAAWLNVFHLLGTLAGITLAAGVLAVVVGLVDIKDFIAPTRGPSLSIPTAAKPGIYRRTRAVLQSDSKAAMLGATVLLAVAANFYELLCTAGFPMVYTRLLTLAEPSAAARYAWLALYNLVYVLPLLLIVLAFVGTLAAHKLSEREGRLLKLLSGTMMLELGLLLAFAPAALNSLAVTALLLGVALAVTALAARLTRPPPRP